MSISIDQSTDKELIRRDSLNNLVSPGVPETDIQRALERIWAEVLGLDAVGIDDDFFDIGGTSSKAAEIFAQIQTCFDSQLPLSSLYNASTIRALAELIGATSPLQEKLDPEIMSQVDRLVIMNHAGNKPPLFMIPGSGGNAISLVNIARALGDARPIYGIDAKGLDGTCEPLYDQQKIVEDHMRIIEQKYAGPYYLFGVCHGGITAIEIAQKLRKKGKEVAFLGLVDPMTVSLPHLTRNKEGKVTLLTLLRFIAAHVRYWRRFYRKRFMRDRLGLLSLRDKLDPQRPTRRKISKANGYAGHRYKPMPYAGSVNLFLTEDCPDGRKKEGRQLWVELLQKPENLIEYIAGTGPSYLNAVEGAPAFAAVLSARMDETESNIAHSDFRTY